MTDPKSDRPVRSGLQQVIDSRAAILDDARPKAVAQQRKRGRWTAREGIAALVDPQSFVEYGGLADTVAPASDDSRVEVSSFKSSATADRSPPEPAGPSHR